MPVKPMLDGVELQQVQKILADDEEVVVQHGVPALEGDFLQDLGRRASRVTLVGVMTGPEASDDLKTWREKFRAAEAVSFVADIATATKVDKVLIEELGVRELAGKSERFEYELTLREFLPPPPPETEEPPAEEVDEQIREEVSDLSSQQVENIVNQAGILEVLVDLGDGTDYSGIMLLVEGETTGGEAFSATSVEQVDGIYRFEGIQAGTYTVSLELQ